jgi:MoxR-like ATPase
MTFDYKYTGKIKFQPQPETEINLFKRRLSPYILDENDPLIEAVNLAISLQRPLLLQGEPGCGKTLLASAVAFEFQTRLNLTKDYPFFPWYIKSTTRAKEGLYNYDSIARLRDAQLIGSNYKEYLDAQEIEDLLNRLKNPQEYIKRGALGEAFLEKTYRPIILIDEIDKADIDFPNDLLRELDKGEFSVVETNELKRAKQPPIVFITSNQEKELPDAFLRRCIYFYIEFPNYEQLIEIVKAHFSNQLSLNLVELAVDKFLEVREEGVKRKDSKKPSTSELIDWIMWLQNYPVDEALNIIDNLAENRALLGTLLKNKDDQEFYRENS